MFILEIDQNLDDLINAILGGLAVLITAVVGAIVTLLKTRSDTKKELKIVKDQVKNKHETNLREDVDEAKTEAANARSEAMMARESSHRNERHLEDIKRSMRSLERSLDLQAEISSNEMRKMSARVSRQTRNIDRVADDLQQHLEDVPNILQRWEEKRYPEGEEG